MIARKQGSKEPKNQQCFHVFMFSCSRVHFGQGLLETIVAIGIITTGLISVISLVISNLTTQRETAMRYQAVSLAREAVELMRNTRDSNWLDSSKENSWSGLPDTEDELTLVFNPTNSNATSFRSNAEGGDSVVYQCANGFYAQNSGCLGAIATPFTRVLNLTFYTCGELFTDEDACANFDNDTHIALGVVATVTWLDQGRQREVKLNETLYDWK